MYYVYWLHLPEHTNIFEEGYVGVTNNPEKRWKEHFNTCKNPHFLNAINKYGWDLIVKEVVLISNVEYCLFVEEKLRPADHVGWNIVVGGGIPPSQRGAKRAPRSEEYCQKIKNALTGKVLSKDHRASISLSKAKENNPNYGKRGPSSTNYKGDIVATNISTGNRTILKGKEAIRNAGFDPTCVSFCVRGKKAFHKGHTFIRQPVHPMDQN